MRGVQEELQAVHPADWTGASLPTHPDWEVFIDDMGCPVWSTATAAPVLKSDTSRGILRIDDPRTIGGVNPGDPTLYEYTLTLLGLNRPLSSDEYLASTPRSRGRSHITKLLQQLSTHQPQSPHPVAYEIEIGADSDPREFLGVIEAILNGEYILTKDTGLEVASHRGQWTLHVLD